MTSKPDSHAALTMADLTGVHYLVREAAILIGAAIVYGAIRLGLDMMILPPVASLATLPPLEALDVVKTTGLPCGIIASYLALCTARCLRDQWPDVSDTEVVFDAYGAVLFTAWSGIIIAVLSFPWGRVFG